MSELITFVGETWELPLVRAISVVVISLVAGKIVDLAICRLVMVLARKSLTDLDDRLIQSLHKPLFISVVLYGLFLATRQLALEPPAGMITVGVIQTLATVLWTVAGLRVISIFLQQFSRLTDRVRWLDLRTVPLFDNLAKIVVIGSAIYIFLLIWDLDVKPWLASAGIIGIAIGFAAKDSLAHLFSGLFIIVDAPYRIGDFINLDSGERGRVTQIGLRSTRILTRNDVEITIPNGAIGNAKISNESGGYWVKSRVEISVGVAYGSDVDKVREVLLQAARSVEQVLDDPEPRIRFSSMGDSALIFRVLCWIAEPVLRGRTIDALNTTVYKSLAAAGITIPFPQRDLHIHQPAPPAAD